MSQTRINKGQYKPRHRRRPKGYSALLSSQYSNGYYHLCIKTSRSRPAFKEESDYIVFLALLKQFLRLQRLMTHLHYDFVSDDPRAVKLLAYKLNPTGCQLLLNTSTDKDAISRLAHSVLVAYEAYFGRKYTNRSKLFNHNCKLTKLESDSTVVALSQAINQDKLDWQRSSREYYIGKSSVDWVHSHKIIKLAGSQLSYRRGLATLN